MSTHGSITIEWADGEYTFRLAIGQLRELQEKTASGPMEVFERLQQGKWRVDDIRETIRLGLVGGGMPAIESKRMVDQYVDAFPLLDNIDPARTIIAAAIIGAPDDPVGKHKAEEAKTEATVASSSPLSMDTAPPLDGVREPSTD